MKRDLAQDMLDPFKVRGNWMKILNILWYLKTSLAFSVGKVWPGEVY